MPDKAIGFYDDFYERDPEPWGYSRRAAEVLRHERIVSAVKRHAAGRALRILDLGCSLGQLTSMLVPLAEELFAADASAVAIAKLKAKHSGRPPFRVITTKVGQIPMQDGGLDAVVLADGVVQWGLTPNELELTLLEVCRVLRPGGIAVFTEFLSHDHFDDFVRSISRGPLRPVEIAYLKDRLWYKLERSFSALPRWDWIQGLFSSRILARLSQGISAPFGKAGANHVLVVARKPGSPA